MSKVMDHERRTHQRIGVDEVVFVTFRPYFEKVGWLKDISQGGICMEYTVLDQYNIQKKNTSVDLFDRNKSFKLLDIPCHVVYDVQVQDEDTMFSSIETRRCGIQFGGLNSVQRAQLEKILRQFSKNEEQADGSPISEFSREPRWQ